MEDEFNNLVHDKCVEFNFSLLHINARSLAKNLHQLIVYLEANNVNYSLLNISGYNSLTNYRTDRRGGDVAIYIHESLAYKERLDLTTNITSNDECEFADVQHSSFGTKFIGVIYRPPDTNVNSFTLDFECVIAKVSLSKHEYLIAGDFNFDLLKQESHKGTQSFINTIYSNFLYLL